VEDGLIKSGALGFNLDVGGIKALAVVDWGLVNLEAEGVDAKSLN
jgi:hypothetical protein